MIRHYLVPQACLPGDAGRTPRLLIAGKELVAPVVVHMTPDGPQGYAWGWQTGWPDDDTALVTITWEPDDQAASAFWEAIPEVVTLPDAFEWATAPVPPALATKLAVRQAGPIPSTFAALVKTLPWFVQHELRRL